jgi:hypothetical protein
VVKRTLYELAPAKSCVAGSRIPRCNECGGDHSDAVLAGEDTKKLATLMLMGCTID